MNVNPFVMLLLQPSPALAVAQRLGWMLVHTLWQGAILAIGLRGVLAATRWRAGLRWSNVRYACACAALAMVAVCAVATFVESGRDEPAIASTNAGFAPSILGTTSFPPASIVPVPTHHFDWHLLVPLLVVFWVAGVLVLSAWQFAGWMRVRRLRRGEVLEHPPWNQILRSVAERMGVHRAVGLVGSCRIGVPVVIGSLRPVIVIPLAIVNGLSPQQVEAILAHELAHVRRYDYLVNLLQTAVETIFFYHPAVWWISGQIRGERENCCDDIAVAVCGNHVSYAGALVTLEERRGGSHGMALAATDGPLLERVRRLLSAPSPRRRLARANQAAMVALICLAMVIAGKCLLRTHGQVAMAALADGQRNKGAATQPEAAGDQRDHQLQLLLDGRGAILRELDGMRRKGYLENHPGIQNLERELAVITRRIQDHIKLYGLPPQPDAVYIGNDGVQRMGKYLFTDLPDATAKQLINIAGCPVNTKGFSVEIFRHTGKIEWETVIPLASLMNGQSPDVKLEPNDWILIVDGAPATQPSR